MKFKCLSTGSQGNCYLLESADECLILDVGCPLSSVKIATGFNVRKLTGAVVTHEHKDHAGYVRQYQSAGIKCITPYVGKTQPNDSAIKFTLLGNYKVTWFPLTHDVPCFGYLIEHPGFGRLLYVTDTEYCKYRFKNIQWFIVEGNYDKSLLNEDLDGTVKRDHVLRGHMDIDTTCRFIAANADASSKGAVIVHKSDSQGDGRLFVDKVQSVFSGFVCIAERGFETEL